MLNARETYRKRAEEKAIREKGPDGLIYVYRGLNLFEMSRAGSLPTFADPKDAAKAAAETRAELDRHFFDTISNCTYEPRYVRTEDPSDPKAVPLSEVPDDILQWLYRRIMAATGLVGEQADQAATFPGGRDELRPPSRNGKGHGGAPKPDRANRSRGVAGARGGIRSHGLDQGADVARGAAGEGASGKP